MGFLLTGCQTTLLPSFEAQHPSRLEVPTKMQKIFIKENWIQDGKDQLKIKPLLLEQLKNELNRLGRFQVMLVKDLDVNSFDPEKETVGVIQGEIISRGELDRGQFSEKATCKGGVSGVAGSIAAVATDDAVTVSPRFIPCHPGSVSTAVTEVAVNTVLSLLGNKYKEPVDEVIRTYHYKNMTFFVQAQLSLTLIGSERKTLAIRTETASFGRHWVDRDSYKNVNDSFSPLESFIATLLVPAPLVFRGTAVVAESSPRQEFYTGPFLPQPGPRDLAPQEKDEILLQLTRRVLDSFIQTISPYKIKIEASLEETNSEMKALLVAGKWTEAKAWLGRITDNKKTAADWYHLGLSYEASAAATEDYEEAKRFYLEALKNAPGNRLYASSIGRMERQLEKK